MAMSFVKVYFDFEDRTAELNEVEKGRLLLAMLKYAQTGEAPQLKGNERFLFPVFKADIDRDATAYATKIENGARGGRQTANRTEPNGTEPNRSEPDGTETNRTEPNGTETERIRKTEDYKNKNKNKTEEQEQERGDTTRAKARFTPPDLDAVKAYAAEMGWTRDQLDPQRFVDFYASKGWRVGSQPMKDWRAAARGWVSRDRSESRKPAPVNPALDYDQRQTDAGYYAHIFDDFEQGKGAT